MVENKSSIDIREKVKNYKQELISLLRESKYSEATHLNNKIFMLRKANSQRELKHIIFAQSNEQSMLDKKRSEEETKLFDFWEKMIETNKKNYQNEEHELIKKCKAELELEKQKLKGTLQNNFKPSANLLNLMFCKEKAVKGGKYSLAEILHKKIEEQKAYEISNLDIKKRATIDQVLEKIKQEHDKKLKFLRKRHEDESKTILIKRSAEILKVRQKYENLKQRMINSHEIRKSIKLNKDKILIQSPI